MAVDFSRFSNTDFSTTPFQYVVFGKGGSLLEVELNEAQYLGFLRDRESLRNLGNRCINGEVKSNGTDITITGDLIINGYYIHSLNSTIKSVGLPKFLYAKVSIIDYNGNSVVKNNGYIDGNIIPNTIIDSRMGFETTRRRGIQLEFSTIDCGGAIKLLEDDGHGGIRFSIPTMTLSDSVDKAISELKTNIQAIETKLSLVVGKDSKGIYVNFDDDNTPFEVIIDRDKLSSVTMSIDGVSDTSYFGDVVDESELKEQTYSFDILK